MSELPPIRVLVTGAAGNIGYILTTRIASGDLLGDRKIILHLLETQAAANALEGIVMELHDCAFRNLLDVVQTTDLAVACKDVDIAFLLSSARKTKYNNDKDVLMTNCSIFMEEGEALSNYASPNVKILVISKSVTTNTYFALLSAKNLSARNFAGLTRLDHNRALYSLAKQLQVHTSLIHRVCIWCSHSPQNIPDISNAVFDGPDGRVPVSQYFTTPVDRKTFVESEKERSARHFCRNPSTSVSAANAAIQQMRDWLFGTEEGEFTSMAIVTPDSCPYGIEKGVVFSYPCTVDTEGNVHIVENLEIDQSLMNDIRSTEQAIREEISLAISLLREHHSLESTE